MAAVTKWRCLQSFNNQATKENNATSIYHEGTATTQVRHRARVNSDIMLYCTVISKPIARPMKNRIVANMTHDVEKGEIIFATMRKSSDMNRGGFRPMRSATCPQAMLPTKTPAICTEVIVDGTQSRSHTRFHYSRKKGIKLIDNKITSN